MNSAILAEGLVEQEARALAALNRPNIVAMYEFGEENGQVYLVSELVEGESLRALLDRSRESTRRAADVAMQIAEAMAAAHSAGTTAISSPKTSCLRRAPERSRCWTSA